MVTIMAVTGIMVTIMEVAIMVVAIMVTLMHSALGARTTASPASQT